MGILESQRRDAEAQQAATDSEQSNIPSIRETLEENADQILGFLNNTGDSNQELAQKIVEFQADNQSTSLNASELKALHEANAEFWQLKESVGQATEIMNRPDFGLVLNRPEFAPIISLVGGSENAQEAIGAYMEQCIAKGELKTLKAFTRNLQSLEQQAQESMRLDDELSQLAEDNGISDEQLINQFAQMEQTGSAATFQAEINKILSDNIQQANVQGGRFFQFLYRRANAEEQQRVANEQIQATDNAQKITKGAEAYKLEVATLEKAKKALASKITKMKKDESFMNIVSQMGIEGKDMDVEIPNTNIQDVRTVWEEFSAQNYPPQDLQHHLANEKRFNEKLNEKKIAPNSASASILRSILEGLI